jgi:hypothetical protein
LRQLLDGGRVIKNPFVMSFNERRLAVAGASPLFRAMSIFCLEVRLPGAQLIASVDRRPLQRSNLALVYKWHFTPAAQ